MNNRVQKVRFGRSDYPRAVTRRSFAKVVALTSVVAGVGLASTTPSVTTRARKLSGKIITPQMRLYFRFTRQQRRPPRLRNPDTLTDMIARVMILKPDPLLTTTADKAALGGWVTSVLGPGFMPTRFQVADSFDELNLDALPDAVVIKASHSSGRTVIVTGVDESDRPVVWDHRVTVIDGLMSNVDREQLRSIVEPWLAFDHAGHGGERHYAGITPRIVAEENLNTPDAPLIEYAFYCVKGTVVYAEVCHQVAEHLLVDRSYRRLALEYTTAPPALGTTFDKPDYFDEMVAIAERLASYFDATRVDLNRAGDRTLVNEISHTTYGGASFLDPPEFGKVFGRFWRGDRTIPEEFYVPDP